MPSHSKHAYPGEPERPRVYDGKPLRRSEYQLRADVTKARAEMRESAAWKTSLAKLRELSLCQGYVRPTSSEKGWGIQNSATMPGDPASSPAAQADDIAQQLREAFAFVHPMDDLPSRMTPAQRAAIQWQCDQPAQPGSINRLREARFSVLAKCARALDGWNATLGEHSPPWVRECVPPRPHYALIDCCIEACGLPDAGLVEDLVVGAPCVGTCPDSGMFRADWQPAALDIDALDHETWHRDVDSHLRSVARKSARHADLVTLYERTMKEVKDGWATSLGSLKDAKAFFGDQPFREMIRFAVEQKGEIRPCDNGRSSLHNLATALHERLVVDSADFPARAAALYVELLGKEREFAFQLGTEDIASAYRRMPCCAPWYTVFAQWNPHTESVEYFRLQGFNFGLKSAVNAFNRLSSCIRELANRLLAICCSSYFDDFCVSEPTFAAGGQQLLRDLAALVGVPFAGTRLGEHRKSIRPAFVNAFLGVQHDFSSFERSNTSSSGVSTSLIDKLGSTIGSILEKGSFAGSAGPLKLAGQLQFSLSWCARRLGRAATQPIHRAGHALGRNEKLDKVTEEALKFLRDLLVDPASGEPRLWPRVFTYGHAREPHAIVWSDACWEDKVDKPAGIGFVVFIPASPTDEAAAASLSPSEASSAAASHSPSWTGGAATPKGEWYVASYHPPREMLAAWRTRQQYVGQLELLAAIAVYYSLADVLRGRKVVHYIDNSGAMAILVKDYSSDIDSAQLVNTFYALTSALEVDVWFDYVKSAANIADWPSRGQVAFAYEVNASRIEGDRLKFPKLGEWGSVELALAWAGIPSESASSSGPPAKKRRVR